MSRTCDGCGKQGAELCVMGQYSAHLCENCRENNPRWQDGDGTRMRRYADVERERFEDGIADMAKLLSRG